MARTMERTFLWAVLCFIVKQALLTPTLEAGTVPPVPFLSRAFLPLSNVRVCTSPLLNANGVMLCVSGAHLTSRSVEDPGGDGVLLRWSLPRCMGFN